MSKKRMKVMTVVGTRPELIRLSRIIAVLDRHTSHTLVHTGQNHDYELSEVFFDDLGIPTPDQYLGGGGSGRRNHDRKHHHQVRRGARAESSGGARGSRGYQ